MVDRFRLFDVGDVAPAAVRLSPGDTPPTTPKEDAFVAEIKELNVETMTKVISTARADQKRREKKEEEGKRSEEKKRDEENKALFDEFFGKT
jgi:hypothetical protein